MACSGHIEEFRYFGSRETLKNEQQMFKNHIRELININGIDATYFRHDAAFYQEPSGYFLDYTLGEDTTKTFFLSADVVVLMNVNTDAILMNRFGLENKIDAECYILAEEFKESFRDMLGTPHFTTPTISISGEVCDGLGIISGDLQNSCLDGFVCQGISISTSGYVSGTFSQEFKRYPQPYNSLIKFTPAYTEREVNGIMTGTWEGYMDDQFNGIISGTATGDLFYYTEPASQAGPNWGIAPQVGDFFRIQFDEESGNREEYEISQIQEKDLTFSGMNPLLSRYVFKMSVVRRNPSHETVIENCSDSGEQEPWTPEHLRISDFHEIESNRIFDYDKEEVDECDGKNSDDIYGGYGSNRDIDELYGTDEEGNPGKNYYVNPFKDCEDDD